MPPPSLQLPRPIKVSVVNPPIPFRRPAGASLVRSTPLQSKKVSKATIARSVNPPPLPKTNSTQARSQTPPSGGQRVSVQPATAKHYVVVDPVGNCTVVDAKPADGLKIAGDKLGYTSLEAANQALKACKEFVERGGPASPVPQEGEAKFKAAQAKAKLSGVDTLTQEAIEGLSYEQIKQLRGY